ncbi:hypothetical protein HPB49_015600 [Dermacentor silvarum]|uniref:Uncharacterized protein n=1 Tax=Dermacentor silvarum TaxID=543639 RepID=A0ACB8D6L6_DERSI|nr:hypothetical protein HPB49_015600 [Dermacentor silvarum]
MGHLADACPRPQPGRCGVQVPDATPGGTAEHQCAPSCLLCGGGHPTGVPGCAGRLRKPIKPGSPAGSKPKTATGLKLVPTPKGGPKKAPAAKPEHKKAQTGSPTNVKSGTQARLPVLNGQGLPALGTRRSTGILELYLQSLDDMPALLALQEPGMDAKFSGYSTF